MINGDDFRAIGGMNEWQERPKYSEELRGLEFASDLHPQTTATGRRILVPTFVDRGMSRGQRGGSPTVVYLRFLDRSRYFSFK
jgi:hypothetical protein